MSVLAENRYGKSRVRLVKVVREGDRHSLFEWSVDALISGDYDSCFRTGDNSDILPTDTMKNTVYSLARQSSAACIEDFAKELISHFLTTYSHAQTVVVTIEEKVWERIPVDGAPHPSAFQQQARELQTTSVSGSRNIRLQVTSGLKVLTVLKSSGSAFHGFLKDRLTTLRETSDRLFGTEVTACWTYDSDALPFAVHREQVRSALLTAFAEHQSLSVQHTLFAMADAALARVPALRDVTLAMPNKHCLLVDLSPFGQDNPNQIFVPTDEPHGYIEARVERKQL